MLCDGHRNALDVRFLKAVLADTAGGHVAGKGHHGHRVHIGGGNAGDQIGRALANYPTLLLADEPTGARDSLAAETLLETFTEMNKNMGGKPF